MGNRKHERHVGGKISEVRDQGIHDELSPLQEHSLHDNNLMSEKDAAVNCDAAKFQDTPRGSSSGEEKDITV